MRSRHRLLLALFVLGLVLRVWGLHLWGTFDTEVQKAWAARAATSGVADIYGPSDAEVLQRARSRGGPLLPALLARPFPRTTFTWGSAEYFVDYPPGSVLVLWAAGKLYGLVDPDLPNRRHFNAAINLAPLLGSIAIALLLARSWRSFPVADDAGLVRALLFWMNPAVLLAAPILGYQDTVFGALALGAVLALASGRPSLATALVVASGLVKPQGALLLPTLLVVVLRECSPLAWMRAAAAGAATAAVILYPWWSRGHLLSALDGCRRPLTQETLAPLGLNAWWIAGWVREWQRSGPWPLARIVGIDAFEAWAGWDPRLVARVLLGAATVGIVAILLRSPRDDRRMIPLAVILQVHAYALVGTSVHENHTLLAVILAPLLWRLWPRDRPLLAMTSGFAFVSLFLAAGFGRRITRQAEIEALRRLTGMDLAVLAAVAHVVLVTALFLWAARTRRAPARTSGQAPPERPV